jgi:hypothetical protein
MVKSFFTVASTSHRYRVFFADLQVIIKRRKKIRPILPQFKVRQS